MECYSGLVERSWAAYNTNNLQICMSTSDCIERGVSGWTETSILDVMQRDIYYKNACLMLGELDTLAGNFINHTAYTNFPPSVWPTNDQWVMWTKTGLLAHVIGSVPDLECDGCPCDEGEEMIPWLAENWRDQWYVWDVLRMAITNLQCTVPSTMSYDVYSYRKDVYIRTPVVTNCYTNWHCDLLPAAWDKCMSLESLGDLYCSYTDETNGLVGNGAFSWDVAVWRPLARYPTVDDRSLMVEMQYYGVNELSYLVAHKTTSPIYALSHNALIYRRYAHYGAGCSLCEAEGQPPLSSAILEEYLPTTTNDTKYYYSGLATFNDDIDVGGTNYILTQAYSAYLDFPISGILTDSRFYGNYREDESDARIYECEGTNELAQVGDAYLTDIGASMETVDIIDWNFNYE